MNEETIEELQTEYARAMNNYGQSKTERTISDPQKGSIPFIIEKITFNKQDYYNILKYVEALEKKLDIEPKYIRKPQ